MSSFLRAVLSGERELTQGTTQHHDGLLPCPLLGLRRGSSSIQAAGLEGRQIQRSKKGHKRGRKTWLSLAFQSKRLEEKHISKCGHFHWAAS